MNKKAWMWRTVFAGPMVIVISLTFLENGYVAGFGVLAAIWLVWGWIEFMASW